MPFLLFLCLDELLELCRHWRIFIPLVIFVSGSGAFHRETFMNNYQIYLWKASIISDQKIGLVWKLKHEYLKIEDCISICFQQLILLFFSCFQALSKALTEDELVYLRSQFKLLEPGRDGSVSLDSFKMVIYCFFSFNLSFHPIVHLWFEYPIIHSIFRHDMVI